MNRPHKLDDDAICVWCGFDAAEWWHLEKMKPKDEREPQPLCERAPPKDPASDSSVAQP